MSIIIGRNQEKQILERLYKSTTAEFLAIYGRRRIGKTFLISQYFKNSGIYLEVTGNKDASVKEQIINFYREFIALFKPEGDHPIPKNWSEAFYHLNETIKMINPKQKIILFFDELPWLATPKSGFLQALDYFWNRHASRMPNVLLIICGSAASWMIRKVVNHRGGLHGRLSAEIRLQPFSLSEAQEYFQSRQISLTKKQIIEIYMATGGVPKYLSYIERGKSSAQSINALCFTPQSPLLKEFHNLYESLFENASSHVKIVRELANKRRGLTQSELCKTLNLPIGGNTSALLEELEMSGFIISTHEFGKRLKDRKYRLVDEYSLFYLKWIDEIKHSILQGTDTNYWEKIQLSQSWHTWTGYAFENICLTHISKIKDGLKIGGVASKESYWRHVSKKNATENGAEIDLVIDRADDCINLCEMKFYNSQYSMTKSDAIDMERKKSVFIKQTSTRKAVFTTLISPYGVTENEYFTEIVDKQLTLDELF